MVESKRRVGLTFVLATTVACGQTVSAGDDTETSDCPELTWADPDVNTLRVTTASEADTLPHYTHIEGHLSIKEIPGKTDLSFLECLQEVEGQIGINGLDLQSLAGLERLERVEVAAGTWPPGKIEVWGNPKLTSVDGLSGLTHVDRLVVRGNPLLVSLEGLSALETAQSIVIEDNDALTTVGLRALKSVEGISISPFSCESASGIPVRPIYGNNNLVEFDGLDSLETFEEIVIAGNENLKSIEGLSHLSSATGLHLITLVQNTSLPYAHIIEFEQQLGYELGGWVCGNSDDPKPCICF